MRGLVPPLLAAFAAALALAPPAPALAQDAATCRGREVHLVALSTDGRYALLRDLRPGAPSGPVVVRDLAQGVTAHTLPADLVAQLEAGPPCRTAAHAECVFEAAVAELRAHPDLARVAWRRLSMWADKRELYPAVQGRAGALGQATPTAGAAAAVLDVDRVRLTLTRGGKAVVERVRPRQLAPDRDADVQLQGFYFATDYVVALVQVAPRKPDCAGAGAPRVEDRPFAFAYPAAPRPQVTQAPPSTATAPPRTLGDAARLTDPYVLAPLVTPPGYANRRFRLSTGDLVQTHTGCGEWAEGGAGFLVQAQGSRRAPRLVTFDAGPLRELPSGHLLLEARRQIGSDGDDAPPELPEGAQAPLVTGTGSIFATRVTAIDLKTGKHRDAGWDTFAPITAGAQRFVVLARATLAADPGAPRAASELLLWDLRTGRKRALGPAHGPPEYRVRRDEVLVRVGPRDAPAYLAVHGSTGKIRPATPDEVAAAPVLADFLAADPPRNLALISPLLWYTSDGRPIHVPETSHDPSPHVPVQGMCGLDGPFWSHGLLFSDEGIFFWPASLSLGSDPADGSR